MRDPAVVRRLCRIYALMLRGYPREFRRRYGAEMLQVFRTACRRAAQTGRRRDVLRFGALAFADWLSSVTRERIAMSRASLIRLVFLIAIGASLAMLGARVFAFRRIIGMPGGLVMVLEAVGVLVVYAIVIIWTTTSNAPMRRTALRAGTWLGVIGAALQIAHLTQETLRDLGPVGNAVSGFGLLLCAFVLWGVAGYRAARTSGDVGSGAVAGCWSAVVTMSLLVVFGFVIEFHLVVPKPENVALWGEFKRSGWTDARAFAVVNTLDAAVSHLVVGPIAGAIFGTVAALFARTRRRLDPPGGIEAA